MKNRRRRTAGCMAVLLGLLCGMVYCPEPAGAVQAAEQVELPEEEQLEEDTESPEEEQREKDTESPESQSADKPQHGELPEESDADGPETNGEGGQQEEAPLETMEGNSESEQDQEQDWDQETVDVSEYTYGGAPETLYPYRSGYYDLVVRDGGKYGAYRIGVQVGARIPGSASYYLYYSMSLIGGEDLGITIAQEDYATMYDNADGYPEEVRQYHLPVRFIHEKTGYHFEAADTSGCYQTYFKGMGDNSCDFVVDTNGCGMTNWGEDGLYHNDIIRVQFVPNSYTITYEGNGAIGGSLPDQTVSYDTWTTLASNTYQKSYAVRYDGMGGTVSLAEEQAVCEFLGWQDRNDFTYRGVDYHWYTIDTPYYANYYRDIMQVFGYDKAAIVDHYVEYTVNGAEARSGSPGFNVREYMDVGGSDLARNFGSDTAAYVSHWNTYGYRENRRGRIRADQNTPDAYPDGAAVRNLTGHVNGKVTLTAKWSDGSITLPTAAREGYELLGWSRTSGADTPDYLPGDTAPINRDCTFYAVWKREKQFFNVAYIGNGQNQGEDFVDYRVDPEQEYALYSNEEEGMPHFTRQGMVSFISADTGETVEEETTQTVVGWSLQEEATRDGMYPLDMIWKGEALYLQAQAAGNITKNRPTEAYGSYADALGGSWESAPADAPEDYVNLYAVWDCGAVIEAYDLYYTLEEARTGKITQEELLRHASATDAEAVEPGNSSGMLKPGVDEAKGTQFIVCDYNAAELQAFCHGGSVTETYLAVDSAGNITTKQITVHIVDTTAEKQEDNRTGIRFISREYLHTLPEDSVWVQDIQYRNRLEEALASED